MSSAHAPLASPPAKAASRVSRLGGMVKLLFACVVVFATCGPSVDAQEENAAAFFRADRARLEVQRRPSTSAVVQRPTRLIRRAAPVPGYARLAPREPREHREVYTPPARANASRQRTEPQRERPLSPASPTETVQPEIDVVRSLEPAAHAPDTPDAPVLADGGPAAALPLIADASPPPSRPQTAPRPPESIFTVAVIGDSLGQLLSQGLTEAFADKADVSVLRRARENTGLVRDDYFDWSKGVRDLLGGADKINLALMMIGSNDRQVIREGGASVELRSLRWLQAYGDRVEAIAQAVLDKKIPMLWVGLPVMKNDRFSADMAAFNEIFKERASRAGAIFVDAWEPFLDDRGLYAAYGPDVNGQFQKLRSADGVHFTRPGARKLAYFLESEVRHAIDNARPKVDLEIAAVARSVRPGAVGAARVDGAPAPPARPATDVLLALPLPPVAPLVAIPVKPAEGAVVALTTPTLSPGGRLVGTRVASATGEAQALIDRVLVQGNPLDPRPGRADDFSWPRR